MKKSHRFITNALIMSIVSVLMRGISVSFNAYINRKIGAESMGLFTLVMSVYSFALTVALSCVNLSAVRLTSERCALLENSDKASWKYAMRQVVRSVCCYSLIFGVLSSVLLFTSSGFLAEHLLGDIRTVKSMKVMALSLPAISLSSALSGYFTGLRKVSKNAVVAVSEQFMKIIVTSTALVMLSPGNVEASCLAVVGGGAISEAWSLIINIVMYIFDSGKPIDQKYGKRSVRLKTKLKNAVNISLPSAVGAYARQGLTTLEHLAIPAGLKKSGLSSTKALASYGALQGIAFPLVMFPYAVIGSFTSLLVPEMAERHELNDKAGIASLTEQVYHYSALFSIGACGVFVNYARELGVLIYNSDEAALYTFFLGFLVPFMYLDTAVDSLLKGLGEQVSIMKINIMDSACGLLFVLLTTPIMGIYGYILTMWICEIGNLGASIWKLGKLTATGVSNALKHYIKPVLVIIILSIVRFTILRNMIPICSMIIFVILYILLYMIDFRKIKKRLA